MADVKSVMKLLKDKEAKYLDFRFSDTRGVWQHMSYPVEGVSEDILAEGIMFDGSSIAGWRAINESDMTLKPDLDTVVMDPFSAQATAVVICDVLDPMTGEAYSRCPRSLARRAEAYVKQSKIADTAYFGPEAEFFVFDDVRFKVGMNESFVFIDEIEGPYNTGRAYEGGNMGHRAPVKGGYFPVPPIDQAQDLRSEMLSTLAAMGVKTEKHHHEVAPSQHELGVVFAPLVKSADGMQIYKYVVRNVAHAYGKTATFMPKPIKGDNGSGMHTHQSLWKAGKPLFAGNRYSELSDMALHYIGGILKHARAFNAFTNPTTNSYKRLIPGFEAPVLLAYSARNRSAGCRIPYSASPNGKRVEVRYPDPAANPYLAYAAMLMAGLDGVQNKIHPGDPIDKNLYDLPPEELKRVPTVCGSLREALGELDKDREFLKKGGVFTDDLIDSYLELRWQEVYAMEHSPHPIEFDMYYSA
jgi:glutamine synthetase